MNGKTDMFEESHFDFKEFYDSCKSGLNITPKEKSFQTFFASSHEEYKSFSNIIFSNGRNYKINYLNFRLFLNFSFLVWDPYWTSGIHEYVNDKLPIILIKDASHHAGKNDEYEN